MKDRIEKIRISEGLTPATFAEKIGIQRSALSHIQTGRNNPSLDVIMKIHSAFPNISLQWLIDGVGNMYNENASHSVETGNLPFDENLIFPTEVLDNSEYRKETTSKISNNQPKEIVKQEVKYIEKPQRKITEIRIFFDDDTFEVFLPK